MSQPNTALHSALRCVSHRCGGITTRIVEAEIERLELNQKRLEEALDKTRMALKEVTHTPHNAARWMDFVQQALSETGGGK